MRLRIYLQMITVAFIYRVAPLPLFPNIMSAEKKIYFNAQEG
jgi:hypothetical protein